MITKMKLHVKVNGEPSNEEITPFLRSELRKMQQIQKGFVTELPKQKQTTLLGHWMLGFARQYVIEQVKAPLQKAIEKGKSLSEVIKAIGTYAHRTPDPTPENCIFHNSHVLMKLRDRFFEHLDMSNKEMMFRSAIKMLIVEYEHDPQYRDIFDVFVEWLVEEVNSGNWRDRPPGRPLPEFWKYPEATKEREVTDLNLVAKDMLEQSDFARGN